MDRQKELHTKIPYIVGKFLFMSHTYGIVYRDFRKIFNFSCGLAFCLVLSLDSTYISI